MKNFVSFVYKAWPGWSVLLAATLWNLFLTLSGLSVCLPSLYFWPLWYTLTLLMVVAAGYDYWTNIKLEQPDRTPWRFVVLAWVLAGLSVIFCAK